MITQVFQQAGASVVGISNGTPEAHKAWADKYNLPFTILSDEGMLFNGLNISLFLKAFLNG